MTQTVDAPVVALDTASKPRLSRAEIESLKKSFAENGYVVIKNVIPRDRLAQLHTDILTEYKRQEATGELFSGGGRGTGHLNCFPGAESRWVYDTLEAYGVVDLVRSIAPRASGQPNVGCNLNLPGSVVQHYHMDRTFLNEFMIINIPTVSTDIANGSTEVAPKTHKSFLRYWQFSLFGHWRRNVRVKMTQGDVLVRVSNLWHRGMPNKSDQARPMLAYTWEDGGSRRADPWSIDEGKIGFHPNWFRPTRLGRFREKVMIVAPTTYSAYRFVHSLFTNKGYDS